uniref:Uncharacterized protein n=1 Tax=Coturnix japonica TaxID=93934 RepID=A0A8C2U1M7_COTJA
VEGGNWGQGLAELGGSGQGKLEYGSLRIRRFGRASGKERGSLEMEELRAKDIREQRLLDAWHSPSAMAFEAQRQRKNDKQILLN